MMYLTRGFEHLSISVLIIGFRNFMETHLLFINGAATPKYTDSFTRCILQKVSGMVRIFILALLRRLKGETR